MNGGRLLFTKDAENPELVAKSTPMQHPLSAALLGIAVDMTAAALFLAASQRRKEFGNRLLWRRHSRYWSLLVALADWTHIRRSFVWEYFPIQNKDTRTRKSLRWYY